MVERSPTKRTTLANAPSIRRPTTLGSAATGSFDLSACLLCWRAHTYTHSLFSFSPYTNILSIYLPILSRSALRFDSIRFDAHLRRAQLLRWIAAVPAHRAPHETPLVGACRARRIASPVYLARSARVVSFWLAIVFFSAAVKTTLSYVWCARQRVPVRGVFQAQLGDSQLHRHSWRVVRNRRNRWVPVFALPTLNNKNNQSKQ